MKELDEEYMERYSAFSNFIRTYSRSYVGSDEHEHRFKVFSDNYNSIKDHNQRYEQGEVLYKKGINHFTDLTKDEFDARYHASGLKKRPR